MSYIALVDDREDYYETLRVKLEAEGWKLVHKRSLQGLKFLMPQLHHKLACVILDIKCLHTEDQAIESSDFIGDAITYLDQNYPRFPRVILTGDDKDFEGFRKFNSSEDVFLKTPQGESALIKKLEYYIEHAESLKVRRENLEAFAVFENEHLNHDKERELIELLLATKNPETTNLHDNFAKIRRFLEPIHKTLNQLSSNYLPDEIFTGEQVNLQDAETYLTGRPIRNRRYKKEYTPNGPLLPGHISWIMPMLRMTTSKAGSHDYSEKVTVNALKATVYGLMELLIWFNDFMESKTNY